MKSLSLLFVLLLVASCVHKKPIDRLTVRSPYTSGASSTKTLAVVIAGPEVDDEYETSSGGDTFIYQNIHGVMKEAFNKKLSGAFKSVTFVDGKDKGALAKYDYVAYPRLDIETVYDFIAYGCLVNFEVVLRDKSGKVIGDGKRERKRKFQVSADDAFKIAMKFIFDKTMDDAFKTVR